MALLKKYIAGDGSMRIASLVSSDIVRVAVQHQQMSPLALTALGRAMTGAALMAGQLKEGQRIGLNFRGDGPVASLFAEARYEGAVRAWCGNRDATAVAGQTPVGKGTLEVVRSLPFQKQPHRGTVELASGAIGDDIAFYLNQSHQIPAIVALSTAPAGDGEVLAGGYIIELMPGHSPDTIAKLEKVHALVPSVSTLLEGGAGAEDLVADYLLNFPCTELDHPHAMTFRCSCTMERVEDSLRLLGTDALTDMIADKKNITINCEFCAKGYSVTLLQLQKLLLDLA